MLGELEDLAAIGTLPFEHRGGIMEGVGQHMDVGFAPRDQLAVEPDPAVAVVKGAGFGHAGFESCREVKRLGISPTGGSVNLAIPPGYSRDRAVRGEDG
jgi:hypothetical protein